MRFLSTRNGPAEPVRGCSRRDRRERARTAALRPSMRPAPSRL